MNDQESCCRRPPAEQEVNILSSLPSKSAAAGNKQTKTSPQQGRQIKNLSCYLVRNDNIYN